MYFGCSPNFTAQNSNVTEKKFIKRDVLSLLCFFIWVAALPSFTRIGTNVNKNIKNPTIVAKTPFRYASLKKHAAGRDCVGGEWAWAVKGLMPFGQGGYAVCHSENAFSRWPAAESPTAHCLQ